ncbi:MAG: tyrosine-type recombinase/integrase [Nitrospirota bacterium]|nr:tyrosine-type recombinase/integrase [Nitrospirota bacterium]
MARKGRTDRGLYQRINAQGKPLWYVRLVHNGKECRFGSFHTKTKAREFYAKAKTEQQEGRFFPERYHQQGTPLAIEWIDAYVTKLKTSGKSAKTQYEERRYGEWWKARLAGKRLSQVTSSDLDNAKDNLMGKGYAAETIKHYLKFLRHVLNEAIRTDKLEKNPFAKFEMPKVSEGRTRFLTMQEEDALLHALGQPYAQWARLAILTGLRKTELFSLRWANVDLEQGFVTLPQTKAGKVQYAPLNEEAKALMRGFPSWEYSAWVFPSKTMGSHLDSYNFYGRVFLPAVKKAKLENVTWNTLRHTFASRLAMNGQSDSTIAALLRHSGTALVQRYAHLSPTHLRDAVEGVSGYGKMKRKEGQPTEEKQPVLGDIPNGTGTETGNETVKEEKEVA